MADNRKNSDFRRQGKKLSSSLSMDQKLQLLSGANFWQTHAIPRQNMSAIRVSDGPHGLRKQEKDADFLGGLPSKPAVCYPTASPPSRRYAIPPLRHWHALLTGN